MHFLEDSRIAESLPQLVQVDVTVIFNRRELLDAILKLKNVHTIECSSDRVEVSFRFSSHSDDYFILGHH